MVKVWQHKEMITGIDLVNFITKCEVCNSVQNMYGCRHCGCMWRQILTLRHHKENCLEILIILNWYAQYPSRHLSHLQQVNLMWHVLILPTE